MDMEVRPRQPIINRPRNSRLPTKSKGRIIKKSSAKIMEAIDAIDEKKIAEAPAGVLAGIAKSLSGVIRDLEPPAKTEEKVQQVQFIMYAPRLIPESSLETIQVNE